ncbi:MAG: NADH-quinone oxidoreductase subunit M [Elusimicrobia bacterium]|nr:NADH-quinone oxidoreductase subunit M [Elusimicrobiota bacterium]
MPLLSIITFLPLLGALIILCLDKNDTKAVQRTGFVASGLALLASIVLLVMFDSSRPDIQFVEEFSWIPALNVHYFLGVDGLSMPLVVLTTLLTVVSLVASLSITNRVKEYWFWFLVLETGMIGVFGALDFFLFYVFWEITLVPMYFLIGIWGGPKKEYAAVKFFLYTLFGSVFMLLAIIALYFASEPHTLSILELTAQRNRFIELGMTFQMLVFLGFYLAFAIKVPLFPFHTWLPLAHVEAPTAVSVILAGVLLKMGGYGLLRVNLPMFPEATKAALPFLVAIAVINIVYGALCAMAQKDLKRMVAYSSINHMGYAMLGIVSLSAAGFNGAVFQFVTHGIITGALFLLVGVIYDRTHTRDIDAFGGLASKLPVYAGVMTLASMASLGLPGLAGFIGEFLCFLGAFGSWKVAAAISVTGILVTAAFFLTMIKKVFLGPLNQQWSGLTDMNTRELIAVAPLAVLTILLGVYPRLGLDLMNETMTMLANFVRGS